ncbi:MAG TPA: DinB family protein [Jatrophihabitans sp.]|nr:DinB family protein [Jatrophihabitans sp.]
MQQPPPDTRDWTFVIDARCSECDFIRQSSEQTGARLRATIPRWQAALCRPDAASRPALTVWSVLEYGCHVRDVCQLYRQRLALMVDQYDPLFVDWNQDLAAIEGQYYGQDPARVSQELAAEAEATATAFDAIRPEQWDRPGRRSNGSVFTIGTFAVYFLHDIEHHLHDVAG